MKKQMNRVTTRWFYRVVGVGLLWLWSIQMAYAALGVDRLRVEALKNPMGIDVEVPHFSWRLESDERGVKQTAYAVRVYAGERGGMEVWNSGKIVSDQSIDILYKGMDLQPSTRYYWEVTVWDNKGNESSSSEAAYFETGLMGSGWDGAKWIKATSFPKQHTPGMIDPAAITDYSVSVDFEIKNISAGICFAQKDANTYCMWQINLEQGYPRFRPHIWNAGKAVCLGNIDLRNLINVQKNKKYRLRIDVDGEVAKTYIDNVLIDTRTNPSGSNYGYGGAGIRQDRAEANSSILEEAYFDNYRIIDRTGGNERLLFSEDFSDSEVFKFAEGTVVDGRLFVAGSYSWINLHKTDCYDIDMDMLLVRDNAGIIFSASDTKNMHLWSINARDKANPVLRRHVFTNGAYTASDVDLGTHITKQELLGKTHHVKIAVKGGIIRTYLDEKLVDTYRDVSAGLHNGFVGFRGYFGDGINELVYYDNVKVTTYDPESTTGEIERITFSEDFEDGSTQFVDGEIVEMDGNRMLKILSHFQETCILQSTSLGIPMFRKEFEAANEIKSAKLYATALGMYDVFINGQRVGNRLPGGAMQYDELKPGWTDYFKEVHYQSYDVTSLLKVGKNAIGAHLGTGWWGGAIAHGIYGAPSLGFLAKLVIEYKDGTREAVVTDLTWSAATNGPLLRGDIYDGETYDARKESDWSMPGYDDSGWCRTDLHTEFNGTISAFQGPAVQIREQLRRIPQKITVYDGVSNTGTAYGMIHVVGTQNGSGKLSLKKGETAVYDMGQNMVGWIKCTVLGAAGTKLKFRFGEMLNDKGDVKRGDDGPGGSVYTYNLRTAKATLNYVMKGASQGETYQPSMTFFGFRYCEVTATQDVEISLLTGEVVGSAIEEGSSFVTSHPDVNQLYSNVMWSQRGNFLSVPTDCPQRDERLGWTGDTQIFSRAAIYNADVKAFYHKWMGDMRNSQRSDGAYSDIAPYCWFGFGNAAWGDAGIIVPWTVYLMYGDRSILEENYESMTRYMDFLSRQKGDGYEYNGAGTSFGDWIAYENTDARLVSVCYYAYVAQLMEKIANAMSEAGNDRYALDARKYQVLYANIKKEFGKRYLLADGTLKVNTQTAYLLALKTDLFPNEKALMAGVAQLRKKIVNNGYKLSTGFVGTGILNQTLSQYGLDDIAYDLLLQRNNPSWLYSIDQGATTIWERWDSYTKEKGFNDHPWIMNSFNHYSYGAVSEWMFRHVGGIESDEESPGFKHFILQPTPDGRTLFPQNQSRITWSKADFSSYYGNILSHWERKEDGRITYTAAVPVNTSATLYLPVQAETDAVYEGDKLAKDSEGIEYMGVKDHKAVFELQSGVYRFEVYASAPDRVQSPSMKFDIYPNPITDSLNILCEEEVKELLVVNSDGQIVYKQDNNAPIDVSSWNTGMYLLQITTSGHSYITKVMKE